MLTARYPYFFGPAHAAREATAAAFRGTGTIRERVAALSAAGLLDPTDVRGLAVSRWHLAHADALTDLAFIIQELGTFPLMTAGGFADEVAEARAGRSVVAFALTEPEAGSDVRALTTRAVKTADGYRLTGVKHFISNAPDADRATVFARLDDGSAQGVIACFLVEGPAATPQRVAGHSIGRFDFVDTPARLVSNKGLGLAFATLERCRPSVGLAAMGMAQRAFDETVRHVLARRQFGAPLAAMPVVQARVADMALELEAGTLTALHACWRRDTAGLGERTGYESAVGKVTATEAAQRIIDSAVQLHGGLGVEEDSVVQQLYRDIRPLRIYEGATDVLKTVIAARWLENS
ncbi:MAG: acyl-CoA dehydrogenase [Myxococcota bacterium]